MVPVSYLKRLYTIDRWRLMLCFFVVAFSVLLDPAIGLAVGIIVSFMSNATRIVEGKGVADVKQLSRTSHRGYKVTVNGPLTYVTGEQVEKAMKGLSGTAELCVMKMGACVELDTDAVVALEHGVRALQSAKPPCVVLFRDVRHNVAEQMRVAHGLAALEREEINLKDLDIMMTVAEDEEEAEGSHLSSWPKLPADQKVVVLGPALEAVALPVGGDNTEEVRQRVSKVLGLDDAEQNGAEQNGAEQNSAPPVNPIIRDL